MSDLSDPPEIIILCEGYHDRAFWKGFLKHFGCADDRTRSTGQTGKGEHFYLAADRKRKVTVKPCDGIDKIPKALAAYLTGIATRPLEGIIISVDDDRQAGALNQSASLTLQSLKDSLAAKLKLGQVEVQSDLLLFKIDGGESVNIQLMHWASTEADTFSLPRQQTLERLVCAALNKAYPNRSEPVVHFLNSRGDNAPVAGPKEFAYSHVAGWYAEKGIEECYQSLWRDDLIRKNLIAELQTAGVWEIMNRLANVPPIPSGVNFLAG